MRCHCGILWGAHKYTASCLQLSVQTREMGKRKSIRKPLLEADDNEQGLTFCEEDETTERELVTSEQQTGLEEASRDPTPDPQPQYSCRVSGPGLETATANCATHVLVELRDMVTGQPCTHSQTVSAELISQLGNEEKHHSLFWRRHKPRVVVEQKTTATYCTSFTAVSRGHHKLHIAIGGVEVEGSPCDITVYPDPHQLKKPIGEIPNRANVWGTAVNSRGQIIASDFTRNEVVTMDKEGEVISSFDCRDPTGITVDSEDNVYVSCVDRIEKFTSDGAHIKTVGKSGHKEGEFISAEGLAYHKGHIYVCDTLNNRIQVLDTDLNFVKIIGCEGSANIEFSHPWDIEFDSAGRAYIADKNNDRVQVIDVKRGGFLKVIGHSGKLSRPTGVTVVGEFVYVSDDQHSRVAVFRAVTGEFVTSFGGHSDGKGKKYKGPFRICSGKGQHCFIYVFDTVSSHIF